MFAETLPQAAGFPRIRWDRWTGGASRILGKLSPPSTLPAGKIAKDWVGAHKELTNLGPDTFGAMMSLEPEPPIVSTLYTLVRWRQWVDGVPVQHALEVAVGLDGVVLAVQGTLVPLADFEEGFSLDENHAATAFRLAAGEPVMAPVATAAAWIQGSTGVMPAWHAEIPWYTNAHGEVGGGWSGWVSGVDGRVLGLTDTTSYADAAWQARDFDQPLWSALVEEPVLGSGAYLPTPGPHPCGRMAASGDLFTLFDGDAISGLYNVDEDDLLALMPLEPRSTHECWNSPLLPTAIPLFERTPLAEDCADGTDNDGDSRTDCWDSDCVAWATCAAVHQAAGIAVEELDCGDGLDDGAATLSGDGLVDGADPECRGSGGPPLAHANPYVVNAGWRAYRFAQEFLALHTPTAALLNGAMPSEQRLNIVVERPLARDGRVLPRAGAPNRSFMRKGLHWLPHNGPLDVPGGFHYGDRYTVMLSRGGSETTRDSGSRGAGVLFHEMGHWWLRGLAGNLGRGFNNLGAPTGSEMSSALDEGLAYYNASAYLSSLDAVPPPPGAPAGWRPPRETVDFVASYGSALVVPHVMSRYHLTWPKVSPCFRRDAEDCDAFASYAGPQFVIEQGVNDELWTLEYCDFSWHLSALVIPATPPGTWWNGIEVAAVAEAALNNQSACVAATASLPPASRWSYTVKWHANRQTTEFQGMRLECSNCEDLAFGGSLAPTLGFTEPFTNPDLDSDPDPLLLSAPQKWPLTPHNPNCTAFRTSVPGAPPWAGSELENDTTGNCDDQNTSSNYFLGDLLAQSLWHARRDATDTETFDAAVLDAAAIMRDCPTTDSMPVEGIPDCPEVFLDFFDYVRLFRWWREGTAELDRLTGLFQERELQ